MIGRFHEKTSSQVGRLEVLIGAPTLNSLLVCRLGVVILKTPDLKFLFS